MLPISKENQTLRFQFLRRTREFLWKRGFIELDTPSLKPTVGQEPNLDPFLVQAPQGGERGYLITSPEYSLKQSLCLGHTAIFEIAHVFRSGEKGSPYHSSEFLMLELYRRDWEEKELRHFLREELFPEWMRFAKEYLGRSGSPAWAEMSMLEAFRRWTGRGYSPSDLAKTMIASGMSPFGGRYEEDFFWVFLNCIEPHLQGQIFVLYDFPEPCASLAIVEAGAAKRFEIYWDGVELANGFSELTDGRVQRERFLKEKKERQVLGKSDLPLDEDFLGFLEGGHFPKSAGVSLGLDRILMKLLGADSLAGLSPYFPPPLG